MLQAGDLRLDPATKAVSRGNAAISLSAREFALLELLLRHKGDVLSRTAIIDHVWDFAYDGTSNVVDVYVRYLRDKVDRPFGRRADRDRARRRLPIAPRRRLTRQRQPDPSHPRRVASVHVHGERGSAIVQTAMTIQAVAGHPSPAGGGLAGLDEPVGRDALGELAQEPVSGDRTPRARRSARTARSARPARARSSRR